MKTRVFSLAVFSLLFCLLFPALIIAQESGEKKMVKTEEEKPDKVATGVIASSAGKAQQGAVPAQTGADTPGGESTAISGSVSSDGKSCFAKLINSSEKTAYRVRYQVIGKNSKGKSALKKTFSGRIKPKQTLSKKFSCRRDLSMSLNLRSAVPLSSK